MTDETASPDPIASALADPANQRLLSESVLTYQEIEHASDRVCAIVTAAWLEGRLQHALSWRLADPAYQKKVGILAAYKPKVDLGYLIGVYSEEARDNFLAIGNIRNRFAHRTNIRRFAHCELEPFFKKITIHRRLRNMGSGELHGLFPDPLPDHADERARFIASTRTLDGYLLLDPFDHAPVMGHAPRF